MIRSYGDVSIIMLTPCSILLSDWDFLVLKASRCLFVFGISWSLFLVDLENWLNFLTSFNSGTYSIILELYKWLLIVMPSKEVSDILTFLKDNLPNFSCFWKIILVLISVLAAKSLMLWLNYSSLPGSLGKI